MKNTTRFCCICCEYVSKRLFLVAPETRDRLTYQCKPCIREHFRELNSKKGYYKKYYYKKKGSQFILPTPVATIVPTTIPQIQTEVSPTPIEHSQGPVGPIYSVSFA